MVDDLGLPHARLAHHQGETVLVQVLGEQVLHLLGVGGGHEERVVVQIRIVVVRSQLVGPVFEAFVFEIYEIVENLPVDGEIHVELHYLRLDELGDFLEVQGSLFVDEVIPETPDEREDHDQRDVDVQVDGVHELDAVVALEVFQEVLVETFEDGDQVLDPVVETRLDKVFVGVLDGVLGLVDELEELVLHVLQELVDLKFLLFGFEVFVEELGDPLLYDVFVGELVLVDVDHPATGHGGGRDVVQMGHLEEHLEMGVDLDSLPIGQTKDLVVVEHRVQVLHPQGVHRSDLHTYPS